MHLPQKKLETRNSKLETKGAFTLIELLVVISIIAILMAVASVSYLNAQQKGRDNKRKTDLKAIQQALEIYYNQNAKYPTFSGTGQIQCNLTGDANVRDWGTEFYCDENGSGTAPPKVTYMNPLPKEPVFTAAADIYFYDNVSSGSYKISAKLENTNDKDFCLVNCIVTNKLPCQPTGTRSFCVVSP